MTKKPNTQSPSELSLPPKRIRTRFQDKVAPTSPSISTPPIAPATNTSSPSTSTPPSLTITHLGSQGSEARPPLDIAATNVESYDLPPLHMIPPSDREIFFYKTLAKLSAAVKHLEKINAANLLELAV